MSREALTKVVDQAVKDTRFRSRLLKDPKGTLSGLNLARDEFSALTQLTNESFDFIGNNVDTKAMVTMVMNCTALREGKESLLSRYNLTDLDKILGG